MTPEQLEESVKDVVAPFLVSSKKYNDHEYVFTLNGKKRSWEVKLDFSSGFPFSLPSIELLNTKLIGSIPHVNINGTVCIQEGDSLLMDYQRPSDLIHYTLDQTVLVLNKGELKIYQDELIDEYEGYFQPVSSDVNSFYEAKELVEHAYLKIIYPTNSKRQYSYPVLLYGKNPPSSFSDLSKESKCQIIKIIHIPFISATLPPNSQQPITLDYIKGLLNNVTNKKALEKILSKEEKRSQHYVLLSFPRSIEGERSQILLNFKTDKSSVHPLLSKGISWDITLFFLTRNNESYLLERGGADNNLSDKKVALIGCGSVGSEVAAMIAKSGVGELTLIDNDLLEADNIYRHRLGGNYLTFNPSSKTGEVAKFAKVSALAHYLKTDLPYIKVNTKPDLIKNVIDDKDLSNSDVVIVAVGSPSLSLWINRNLKKHGHRKIIFCWNEAASLGGHSISLDLDKSCYECLYTDTNGFKLTNEPLAKLIKAKCILSIRG